MSIDGAFVVVDSSHVHGQGLFCLKDVSSRSFLLMDELPIVSCLMWSHAHRRCDFCWKTSSSSSSSLLVCSVCKMVRFCNRNCQKQSWTWDRHRGECGVFQRMNDGKEKVWKGTQGDVLRLALRMSWAKTKMRDTPHLRQDVVESPHWMALSQYVISFVPPDVKKFWDQSPGLLHMLQLCSMRMPSPTDGTLIAVAIFSRSSAANHSCDPNATIVFCADEDDRRAQWITNRPVKKGEEITLSYIQSDAPLWIRRFLLWDSWKFFCQCTKCHREDSLAHNAASPSLLWRLYESIGDSERSDSEASKRFVQFCANHNFSVESSDPKLEQLAEFCAKAFESSQSVPSHAGLRCAELIWNYMEEKQCFEKGSYFWKCALHRLSLHCIKASSDSSNPVEVTRVLLAKAAKYNLLLATSLKETVEDATMMLGCLTSACKCLAWEASFALDEEYGKGLKTKDQMMQMLMQMKQIQSKCRQMQQLLPGNHGLNRDVEETEQIVREAETAILQRV